MCMLFGGEIESKAQSWWDIMMLFLVTATTKQERELRREEYRQSGN